MSDRMTEQVLVQTIEAYIQARDTGRQSARDILAGAIADHVAAGLIVVDGTQAEPQPVTVTPLAGMDRIERFAGHAIAGLMANPNIITQSHRAGWELCNCTPSQIADYAVGIGEQMDFWMRQREGSAIAAAARIEGGADDH